MKRNERIPQLFLEKSTPSKTTLAFVLTSDLDAAAVMRLAKFSILLTTPQGPLHFHDADYGAVAERYGDRAVFEEAFARIAEMFSRRPNIPRELPDVTNLIEELHVELREFLD